MKSYSVYTDLACESEAAHDCGKRGTKYSENEVDGFQISRLDVEDKEGEKLSGKKIGSYITIFSPLISSMDSDSLDRLRTVVSREIDCLSKELLERTPSCVLVAGLGNREITADSIGPKTVDRLTVTRHIKIHDEKLFEKFSKVPLCAVAPGVLGQTGIETLEMVKGVCQHASPDLVIAIDALAARSTKRLGATVQISNSGIFPGSGIGNRRREISKETLGIPVIAVGVPTVVNSSTLVYDALGEAGYRDIDENIERVLREGESFFVSPRQSDQISESVSLLLSGAIDDLFLS